MVTSKSNKDFFQEEEEVQEEKLKFEELERAEERVQEDWQVLQL